MMLPNPYYPNGLSSPALADFADVADTNQAVAALLAQCPAHAVTPLIDARACLPALGKAGVWLKDESKRMGLGSFKALGAAYVLAYEAAKCKPATQEAWSSALHGQTFIAASAGNHGLSLAAGAKVFGAQAVIVLSETVPTAFAQRLRNKGAQVVVQGADYAASMQHAQTLAAQNGWQLISDSSWPGYADPAWLVMQGYTQLAAECVADMPEVPTHIYLQAGVGGLAAACAAVFRQAWGGDPQIIVVEPQAAPALQASIQAGEPVFADGPVSTMGRLDCKEPSYLALKCLAKTANAFWTITDAEAQAGVAALEAGCGLTSSPSGTAGLAAAMLAQHSADDRVLCIISEGGV